MKLLIVTGMSGSGKSSVMDVMEDIGYYCIDNIPPKLIRQFVELCNKSEMNIDKIAVAVDIRTGEMFAEIYDIAPGYAAQTVGVTSLFTIVTLPCVMLVANLIV